MMEFLDSLVGNSINLASLAVSLGAVLAGLVFVAVSPRLFRLVLKNLGRNRLRTVLTGLAIMVLVFMVTLIWTIVYFLDEITTEKAKDFKLILSEKRSLPSLMPLTHADYLNPNKSQCILRDPQTKELLIGKDDFMTWSFYVGTTEPGKFSLDSLVFFFVMDADHILTMMDDLEGLDPNLVSKMKKEKPEYVLMGKDRLKKLNKRVGDSITVSGMQAYKNLDLKVTVIGELPEGRHSQGAIMNAHYFYTELDQKKSHPLARNPLNLIWLRVKDRAAFASVLQALDDNKALFADRPIKCETFSSGIGAFLDAYRDLLWGVKWLLVPAILVTMALVVANSISISVRERRTEMAVLKVLGYRPRQVLALVLGEALLVAGLAGLATGALTYALVTHVIGGIPFAIGFFPKFFVPAWALAWGLAMGCGTALVGSVLPAWSARSVRVSDVFAKVA